VSILIVGSGALACLFAARLSAAGQQVNMLAGWPEGLAALQRNGVTQVSADRAQQSYAVNASAKPTDFIGAQLVLVLVKSWQTPRAAQQLNACLADDGVALTLQNGLGNRETLAAVLGEERVAAGVITTGATLVAPGVVRWGGEGVISLGAHPRLGELPQTLQQAGFKVVTDQDVASLVWSKLVINAAINPLSAVLDVPNGELLAREGAQQLSAQLAQEAAAVAKAQGVALTFADPVAAAQDVARRTAANSSSMRQDVQRGAQTEIGAICGAIVRAGAAAGVATPVNDVMWKLVSALK
jgi:2-dehydropantoate 2-reductase